jgi:hypothetical protein
VAVIGDEARNGGAGRGGAGAGRGGAGREEEGVRGAVVIAQAS